MSKFIPNKSINFLFSFGENYYWIILITSRSLWWPCSITRCVNDGFGISEVVIWCCRKGTWKTAKKKYKDIELQALLGKDDSQTLKKLFLITYERWEKFRWSVDEYHMSWMKDKWKSTKTCVKFCFLSTKGSHCCII